MTLADMIDDEAVESWHRREPPLEPVAVLGVGAVAAALAEATHRRLAEGAELRAVADPEYLVVLGAEATLPWVDGARYLGWDGRALTLTTHRVLPAADLWRDAAIAAEGADPGSLAIVLPEQVLISVAPVRDADAALLAELFGLRGDDLAAAVDGGFPAARVDSERLSADPLAPNNSSAAPSSPAAPSR